MTSVVTLVVISKHPRLLVSGRTCFQAHTQEIFPDLMPDVGVSLVTLAVLDQLLAFGLEQQREESWVTCLEEESKMRPSSRSNKF